jgi:1,4-dihydroxy-2-naphthoate polyprenyltransferase
MTDWIKAARLRTLPLSMSGIIMGSFIAKWRLTENGGSWDWRIFALALLVTLLYQILSNFANDYGDGVKGTDKNRIGEAEQRAVASGKITASQMRNAVILLSILSLIATVALLYVAFYPNYIREFWIFIGLGIACILVKNLMAIWDWAIFLCSCFSAWFRFAEVIFFSQKPLIMIF